MTISKPLVFTLVVSLAANLIPARAWASDDTPSAAPTVVTKPAESVQTLPASPVDLRAAARAAGAKLAAQDRQHLGASPAASNARRDRSSDDLQYGGGGGGSKMGMIMMLVGTVVGIGMAYYMVQTLKKQQNSSSGQ